MGPRPSPTSSSSNSLLYDLLASEFENRTTPTRDADVRVYLGIGVLVKELALFAALDAAGQVEVIWVSFVRHEPETK